MVPEHDQPQLGVGTTVYTEEGDRIGRIRGFDDDGFYSNNWNCVHTDRTAVVRSGVH